MAYCVKGCPPYIPTPISDSFRILIFIQLPKSVTNAFDNNVFLIVIKGLRFNTGFYIYKTRFAGTCLGMFIGLIIFPLRPGMLLAQNYSKEVFGYG